MISVMPYIGGKHRLAREIAARLHLPGVDTLVDVFGGSAAVTLNAGFTKRVYNDRNADIVNVFRCLADRGRCADLHRMLRRMPPSRALFEECKRPMTGTDVERAALTFYAQMFSFGGKSTDGGFSVSIGDRYGVKEVVRYRNMLRRLSSFTTFFSETVLENLDYQEIIAAYGQKDNVVLFCDPPYVSTEYYYAGARFAQWDHWNLAQILNGAKSHVVLTYYETPTLREYYPLDRWNWEAVTATKNSQFRSGHKQKVDEFIISKIQKGKII